MPLPSTRRVRARFQRGRAVRCAEALGVRLHFAALRANSCSAPIEHLAPLDPERSVASVHGLGLVLRILRAARIAAPEPPESLIGAPEHAAALLDRAAGTVLALELRPRSRLRFVAWTDGGAEPDGESDDRIVIEDVRGVREARDAWWVVRAQGLRPVRVPRGGIARHRTELERWYEVLHVERA